MTRTEIDRGRISLTVNGQRKEYPAGTTLSDLLEQLQLHPRTVVVEHNRNIIRDRNSLRDITIGEGDTIELVHFVGGG